MIVVIVAGVAFNCAILVFAEIKLVIALYTKAKHKANQKIQILQAQNQEKRRHKYNMKLFRMYNGDSANQNQEIQEEGTPVFGTPLPNIINEAPSEMEESRISERSGVPSLENSELGLLDLSDLNPKSKQA